MAIKVTKISPPNLGSIPDKVIAHKTIDSFDWVNESTQVKGNTSREVMYDWIVNQRGSAYIYAGGENIFLFGTSTTSGEHYVRAAKNGEWVDDLLELSNSSSATSY